MFRYRSICKLYGDFRGLSTGGSCPSQGRGGLTAVEMVKYTAKG